MRRFWILLFVLTLPAAAQTPASPEKGPAFDVVSIHPHAPGTPGKLGFYGYAGGLVQLGYAGLTMLVYYALDVDTPYVSGAPTWSTTAVYDITATPPDSSPSRKLNMEGFTATPTPEQRAMILNMLVQRFGFRYHAERSDRPVYFLQRGKGALKLEPAKHPERAADPRCNVLNPSGESFGEQITMAVLAQGLATPMGRTVVDRTGLTGTYDFNLGPIDPENKDSSEGGILITRALGLRLVAGRAPIRTIVIDAAHPPTPN
ncbi:MAG: TIGR03435 family protein [Acidobacteriaceae bacterium]